MVIARAWSVLALLVLSVGCNRSQPAAPKAAPTPRQALPSGFFTAAGAPDALACKADPECLGDTVVDGTGCCVVDPMPVAQTRTYFRWIQERRRSAACRDVRCPPLPVPTQPPECTFKVSCVEGQCRNSC